MMELVRALFFETIKNCSNITSYCRK